MRSKFINLNFWVKSLYVILIIGVYLIISPSSVTHCLFIGFKTPLWVMNKLSFSLSMDFFLPQHVIYGHFIHHSWNHVSKSHAHQWAILQCWSLPYAMYAYWAATICTPILTPTVKKTCSYSNYERDHDNLGRSYSPPLSLILLVEKITHWRDVIWGHNI